MIELLWLLLPIAAASGWLVAKQRDMPQSMHPLSPYYFKGLNYLLNEEPDKAIDAFIKIIEIDNETVETHLALGALFRRRGEVNRAIRIHQNLIARPALSPQQRFSAMLELSQDYYRAGLLDRAEYLFQELTHSQEHQIYAYHQLL
ncbi:MAG: lipopolysaccharide assembly protein LapB, partial [Pseudomonadota bacterium]|nr:lipopolysaccharide assembly protein LapB [Pseudomonadota bacterium]